MNCITKIVGREIIDSRGRPTLEVDVTIDHKSTGSFIVPSGASTGFHEAIELRDNDPKRYNGKGVLQAVSYVNTVFNKHLCGHDPSCQFRIDEILIEMDGTKNKSQYGANTILGISMAVAKAYSLHCQKPLFKTLAQRECYKIPYPMMNVINGGAHADNGLDIQEFMICPRHATFRESLRYGSEIFHALKSIIKKNGYQTNVGDEGGFAPNISSPLEALDMMSEAVTMTGLTLGQDVTFALDVAASEFYKDGYYRTNKSQDKQSIDDMIEFYKKLVQTYPITSIEDPFDQDDFEGWKTITKELNTTLIVGDDIFVTNADRLQMGIDQKIGHAIIIKPNQVGTLTETIKTVELAKKNNYCCIISHRSGESEDHFIADLSVALNADYIKTGGLSRSERICKYNQLLRIEEKLLKQYTKKEIYNATLY